jgi:hypothetical protein
MRLWWPGAERGVGLKVSKKNNNKKIYISRLYFLPLFQSP